MNKTKNNLNYHPPLIIQLSISEISSFKEEFKFHILEYSLKFEGVNNNKFNIYNLSYMMKNKIDLIPVKSPFLNSVTIYLIKSGKYISKGILYLNKGSKENIVTFKIKNISIKFHFILKYIDCLDENKNINKNNKIKKINKNKSPQIKIECRENNNFNLLKQKKNDNISYRNIENNIKKTKNINYHSNSCDFVINPKLKTNYQNESNNNLYSSSIENSEINLNKIKFSNIWINNTKILLKKVQKYLTKRNSSKSFLRDKFKKCLSDKNIKTYSNIKNNMERSLSDRKFIDFKIQKSYIKNLKFEKNKYNIYNDIRINVLNSNEDLFNRTSNISLNNDFSYKKLTSLKKIIKKNKKINKNNLENSPNSLKKEIKSKLIENNEKNKENICKDKKDESIMSLLKRKENYEKSKNLILKENNYCNNENSYNMKILSSQNNENKSHTLILNNRYKIDDSFKLNNINLHSDRDKNKIIFKNEKLPIGKNKNKFVIKKNYIEKKIEEIKKNNIFYKSNIINEKIELDNKNNYDYLFETFIKLKNDFSSSYSNNYLQNIKDELLKIEIDMIFEKIIELIYEYHYKINEQKIIYKALLNNYKNNKIQFLIFCKLLKKLKIIKMQNINNIESIQKDYSNSDINNIFIFKSEMMIFQTLFKNNKKVYENNCENKKKTKIISKMLKNILIKILNKNNNQDKIMFKEVYKKWLKDNNSEDNSINANNSIFSNKIKKKKSKIKFRLGK